MLDDWQGALNVSSVLEVIKDPGSTYTSNLAGRSGATFEAGQGFMHVEDDPVS